MRMRSFRRRPRRSSVGPFTVGVACVAGIRAYEARHAPDETGQSTLDALFARNDHGKYDAAVSTLRRARDDLDGLHYSLRCHLDDLLQTQREIIHDACFEEQPRDEIAARRGITLNTDDNHRKAPCGKLRDSCADIDLPDSYDRIEEMNKRHAASQRRRASSIKEKRSSSGGDRSNFEGDRSNFEGDRSNFGGDRSNFGGDRSNSRCDRDKTARARDESVRVATKS